MWHITKGYIPPNLRPDIVKLMLSGRGHEDDLMDREEDDKVPVYLEHLRLLKTLLARDTSMLAGEKAATWAVATLAFWGSFRLTEILSSHAKSIDQKVDLLRRDIRIDSRMVDRKIRNIMIVSLKSPKEAKSNKEAIKVEVLLCLLLQICAQWWLSRIMKKFMVSFNRTMRRFASRNLETAFVRKDLTKPSRITFRSIQIMES